MIGLKFYRSFFNDFSCILKEQWGSIVTEKYGEKGKKRFIKEKLNYFKTGSKSSRRFLQSALFFSTLPLSCSAQT